MVRSWNGRRLAALVGLSGTLCACSGGSIGELSGSPDGVARDGFQAETTTTPPGPAPQCPDATPDVAAKNGWRSSEASEPADGILRFELKARSTGPNLDGLIAVGAEPIDGVDGAAITVRFSDDGLVDVGDDVPLDVAYPYDPGVWYSIGILADIETQTYDVEVGPCGEPRETLIKGASFRDNPGGWGWLRTWAVWSSQKAALEVSTPAWVASGRCVPATCVGQECGQPGDGCGGTLDCGGCGNTELCDSGLCVEELVTTVAAPTCVPDTCEGLGMECGLRSDGCGDYLACGDCPSGSSCDSGLCVADPVSSSPPPVCEPRTCDSVSRECGVASDGCGNALSCGSCPTGETCTTSGTCVAVTTPPPACEPHTCESLGRECGSISDGCGGTLSCGGCPSGQTCASGGMCVDVQPVPPPPPGSGGEWYNVIPKPDATNTGPNNPGILSPANAPPSTITQDGATYENFTATGSITINADNVTLRNFILDGNGSLYTLNVLPGSTGFTAEHGEIFDGLSTVVYDQGTNNTFRYLYVHESGGDAFKCHGPGVLLEYNFIEKLGTAPGAHADGVQNPSGTANQTYRYNNCWMPVAGTPNYPGSPYKPNACWIGNPGSSYPNLLMENNWLNGGAYTVYCSTGMIVRDNLFGRDYAFGPMAGNVGDSCTEFSGNLWEDTLEVIP